MIITCSSAHSPPPPPPPGKDQDPEAVNSQNDAGYTSLHHAAKHGSENQINILVKAGADQMIENNAGETPYMVAHKYQQWEAERLLLNVEQQHGVSPLLPLSLQGLGWWWETGSGFEVGMACGCWGW